MMRSLLLTVAMILPLPALSEEAWPREVPHEGGVLSIAAPPERVVSTTPSLTGVLLAMEVPLLATAATTPSALTDDKGFFTQWAEVADARGVGILWNNLSFDIEALILAEPDLVVGSVTGADSLLQYLPAVEAEGIPVVLQNYSNHSWQEMARTLGRATGHEAGAEAAIARFDAEIAAIGAGLARPEGAVTIIGYNLGGTYSIGRPDSPQARVIEGLGFTVAGLPEEQRARVTRSSDFDFVSRENLAGAITGQTVFLMSADESDVAAFLADPVLANLPAVQAGRVHALGHSSFRIDYYSGLEMAHAIARSLTR